MVMGWWGGGGGGGVGVGAGVDGGGGVGVGVVGGDGGWGEGVSDDLCHCSLGNQSDSHYIDNLIVHYQS